MIKRVLQYTFSLLNIDYVQLTAKWNYRNVLSPYYRIYYIDDGEGEISDFNQTVKLEPGYLYIIPSFTMCNLSCKDKLSQYFVQFFEQSSHGISMFSNNRSVLKIQATDIDIQLFNRLLQINPGRGINRSDDPKIYEKNIYYDEYQELNNSQSQGVYIETQGILMQFLSRFLNLNKNEKPNEHVIPIKIIESLNYILANLQLDLSVTQLASMVYQNVDHFSRQFKQYTGMRPIAYINEKRIERAQYLMATSRMILSDICDQTGFDNLSYFSNTFKKITGMSPSEYKKQLHFTKC
ncbi:AraC family transcriptional regulator [Arachidicoccus ginsenosidivorans]|uniref:Helix-turn-helix transcriptional regulator n=1 Tax=Arachidicoccus ginsenosidivorans TaxID=496057 RepID=A0A5B8VGE5_9BACT|nr:AraC family transcriptional regulator [Arachidicoccus ginsenosidivorans]QEC70667.1 helix-turn-helix transcriptional regulator [Arachidicoccus ginsenosidivorans]